MNRRNIKILLIDDDEDDFFLTKELFEEMPGYNVQVDWTPTIEEGVKSLKNNSHEVYFVDYLLGANTGIDFLRNAGQLGNTHPIIMLTGKGDHHIDKMAMELGAADYLVKSELDVEKLERCLRYAVERYETRIQLEESEAKYRNIFMRTRDMIFITDIQGVVIDTNESATRVLGYSKEEIIGKSFSDLLDDATSREFIIEQISNKTEIHDFEKVIISKNGKRKICLISLNFQGDEINNPTFLCVIHDITKRRKAEQDLITTEKLAVTGRIVRMIAHEIRNPLTNINLSLEQLEAEVPPNPDLKMYFDIIKRNSERISSLITELLNSSKPAQLTISKFSINTLIKETLALIQDRIVLRNVRLVTNLSDDICEISVDSGKIKIALLNIFINAIEAMEEENGILTLSTRGEDNCCVIEVEDNGKGIPESDIGRIFDPFFSGKPKGTGLGLSTTHNIIRTHNGTIDVSNTPGTGTKFTIKLNFD